MSLKMGIVGLPNVGKSTLFNAITNSQVEAANYPFATIDPNVGIVEVPDERLERLAVIFQPEKVVPTTFEFVDIAGLIKGASKGEGLGNAFLSNIRDADAICMVVRCFENNAVTHVEGSVDPVRDVEIINLELIISDQDQVNKRLDKIAKRAQTLKQAADVFEYEVLLKLQNHLANDQLLKDLELSTDEMKLARTYNLLTMKPFLFVGNVGEGDLTALDTNQHLQALINYASQQHIEVVPICAQIEQDISVLDDADRAIFMEEYHLTESGLSQLIRKSYALLGLQTYFTAGKKEVRAWTFKKGYSAPQCAGVIHTDFERGFIRAEVYNYNDLIQYGSEKATREAGKIRSEGKSYIMQDGDVCFFKFNV